MRDRCLGFSKAPRNHLADAAIWHGSMRRGDRHRRGGAGCRHKRRRSSSSHRCRATRQRRIHICLHNPPIGAGTGDFADINASLCSHTPREWACKNAITRCWRSNRRWCGGNRCSDRRRSSGRRGSGFRRGASGGHGLARFHQNRDHIIHLHALRTGGHQDAAQNAFIHRFHFHRRLIGFDFRDHIAGLDPLAFLLQPARQIAFRHGGRKRGHQNICGHDLSPYRR